MPYPAILLKCMLKSKSAWIKMSPFSSLFKNKLYSMQQSLRKRASRSVGQVDYGCKTYCTTSYLITLRNGQLEITTQQTNSNYLTSKIFYHWGYWDGKETLRLVEFRLQPGLQCQKIAGNGVECLDSSSPKNVR